MARAPFGAQPALRGVARGHHGVGSARALAAGARAAVGARQGATHVERERRNAQEYADEEELKEVEAVVAAAVAQRA